MRRRPFAWTLVAWTFFVWTTRIANVWRDDALDTGEKLGRTGLAASFTLLAVAVVVALVRRSARGTRLALAALVMWTVGVWFVRDVRIVAADHDAAFTIVHVVLGVVSVVLATLACW